MNALYSLCAQNGANGTQSFSDMPKYSFEELTVEIDQLPNGVDPAAREVGYSRVPFFFLFLFFKHCQAPLWGV